MRVLLRVLGYVVALYLVGRALAELWVVDLGDPATYRHDWGGPHLAGVLAVHCLPGVVAAVLVVRDLRRLVGRRDRA